MADDIGSTLLAAVDGMMIGRAELGQAAALAAVVRQRRPLTVDQQRAAHRILGRSAALLEAGGLSVPEPPPSAMTRRPGEPPPVVRKQMIERRSGTEMRITVAAPFRYGELLKSLPGSVGGRDREGRFVWHYPLGPASASAVLRALDGSEPQVSPGVLEMAAEHDDRAGARAVLDESSPVPVFDTAGVFREGSVRPYHHQFRAIEYGTRLTASQWAVPMGGGKTMAAIGLVNRTRARRVLIVCPNAVRGVWPKEVRKYDALGWHIVNGRKPSKRARAGYADIGGAARRLAEAEACLFDCPCGAPVHAAVVNYDVLSREPWSSWVPSERVDLVIYDEIHRLKAHNGVTSKVVAKWVAWSLRRVGLTGTPMPQTPLDVFGIFRALDPGIFGTKWGDFKARYALAENPYVPEQVTGYRNVGEMAEKFFSITYRPVVDLDLPPVTDITREFVLEPEARRIYRSLDEDLWAEIGRASAASGRGAGLGGLVEAITDLDLDSLDAVPGRSGREDASTVTPANVMVKLLRLQQLTGGTVIDDEGGRIRVSWAKQKMLAEVLDEVDCVRREGHEPEPVIVFCRFHPDLDAVRETVAERGLTYGEISGRRKDGLTGDADMAPVDVVAVQIQSGGTGIDLTRARVGIWYSLGYSLSDYDQARKRMNRPGQTRPILFAHLLASDTADFDVYEALDARRSVIAGVMAAHGVDAAALGFTDVHAEEEEQVEGDRRGGAVDLPFERLVMAENTRIGVPVGAHRSAGA